MKALMILGGLVGFVVPLLLSWAFGQSWPDALLRAALGAYVTGLLARWWGRVWLRNLQQAHWERHFAAPTAAPPAPNQSRP